MTDHARLRAFLLACAALLALLVFSGCDWSTDTPADANQTPKKKVNERREARQRAANDIVAYCRALTRSREDRSTSPKPSSAARRRAIQGVNYLASAIDEYADSSYNRQLPVRRQLANAATFLERENCLRGLARRLDRAQRLVDLPDPPEPEVVPEEDYDPSYDDYEPTYR